MCVFQWFSVFFNIFILFFNMTSFFRYKLCELVLSPAEETPTSQNYLLNEYL